MTTPATNKQIPDNSILDYYNKQIYLGNGFILPGSVTLSDTSETPLFLVKNLAVSTSAFPVQQALFLNMRSFASSAQLVTIKTYSAPTISSVSTRATPVNLRPASTTTSVSRCYLNGQFGVSANGTLMSNLGCAGTNVPSSDGTLIILDPGQNLLITGTAGTGNTAVTFNVSWYEL